MSPHRLTTYRRYKISDDVLILVLENLDPPSLWRSCKAFRRIYTIVMAYQSLRYKFELAVSGMKDGAVVYSRAPPPIRLQLLLTYRKNWPRLEWSNELKMKIPIPAQVGASGGFIHQIRSHGVFTTLELTELPSVRTNRPPSHTRHLKFTTSSIDSVTVEHSLALVVTSHVFSHNGHVGIQLQFRDLWTFEKHPRASAVSYDFTTALALRVTHIAVLICGYKVAVSVEFLGGTIKHLLMDWRTFEARWLEDRDIQFLDGSRLLAINQKGGIPILSLYNISRVSAVTLVREYELPDTWSEAIIGFSPNSSPNSDNASSSEALFYNAPENRVLVLTARPSSRSSHTPSDWLFIKEAYFRYPSRKDRLRVTWNQLAQYCLIRDLSRSTGLVRGPYVVGARVLYLETGASQRSHGSARLHAIDFAPFPDSSIPPAAAWTWIGPRSLLVATESSRSIPSATVDSLKIEDLRVTEDNIVLFLEIIHGHRLANVLTFGSFARR